MSKVINISAKEAEGIQELPDNTVLISIGEENGDFWNLKVEEKKF